MIHIAKTYILQLLFFLIPTLIFAQVDDNMFIHKGEWGTILSGEKGYAWLDNKGDTIFGFGELLEITTYKDSFDLVYAENSDGKKGCFNIHQEIVIPFIYDKLSGFAENGLAFAAKEQKYGYIDKEGTNVIPFIYDDADWFRKGIASVKYRGKYGCLNAKNDWVIPSDYSEIQNWNDNWVLVKKDDKWAFFDKSGKQWTGFCYDEIRRASKDSDLVCINGLGLVVRNGEYAYLNSKLQEVVPFGTFDVAFPFNENQMGIVGEKGKWGIIDSLGQLILPLEYDEIDYVSAYGSDYELLSLKKNGRIAVMSAKTREKTKPCYLTIYKAIQSILEDGKFKNVYVAQSLDNKYGCIDDQLNIKIPFEYSDIRPIQPFIIATRDSSYGLLNWQNEIVVEFVNDHIYYCQFDDLYIISGKDKAYIMDAEGNILLSNKYESIQPVVAQKRFIVRIDDKVGVAMLNGDCVIPCEYDSISSWWEYGPSAHYVVKDEKVGIIDYNGEILLPTDYDSLDFATKDVVIVTKNSKYGVVDINNRLVLPFEYDDIKYDSEEWCTMGYEYIRFIYVCKNGKFYKYDRENYTMERMLQTSQIEKIFRK